jgi:hypothetical protein
LSIQEAALYGELVRYLRDRLTEMLASEHGSVEETLEQLDAIIRGWFFTPQDELHGCAPRDLIWAEQKGVPNPIHPERLDEFFVDDCPICQAEFEEVKVAIEAGEAPSWHWYYDIGGYPLIARYDPEGWDACWARRRPLLRNGKPTRANRRRLTTTSRSRLDTDLFQSSQHRSLQENSWLGCGNHGSTRASIALPAH